MYNHLSNIANLFYYPMLLSHSGILYDSK